MTAQHIRLAAAWLRQQAAAQGAREAEALRDRLRMRERVGRQARDERGRWTEARS
jgi:hypothetical protein